MKIRSRHNKITEYELTAEEFISMRDSLRGACLAETMGPNWKDLYWSPINRPFVKK